MDAFSSSPLNESFPSSRFSSPVPSPTRTETDFPIDVDQSFNSSMSFSNEQEHEHDTDDSPLAFSPTPNPSNAKSAFSPVFGGHRPPNFLGNNSTTSLSPIPAPSFTLKPRRPQPVPLQSFKSVPESSSSSSTATFISTKRTFGRELSLNPAIARGSTGPATARANANAKMMPPPAVPDIKAFKPRAALPMQWTSSQEGKTKPLRPMLHTRETEPVRSHSASSSLSDAMDLDSPAPDQRRSTVAQSPSFSGSASFSGSPGLGAFFCESPAPPAAMPPSKRRSLLTGSPGSPSGSPSAKRASLGYNRNMDKVASSSAMLFGGGRPSTIASRRAGQPYVKRPGLTHLQPGADSMRSDSTLSVNSAYPILQAPAALGTGGLSAGTFPRTATAPMRRAFSVCDQSAAAEMSEDESELENSPCVTATQVEYARRHGVRAVPRVDGSPNFKPARSSIAVTGQTQNGASPLRPKIKRTSPYGPGGLPGFGDNEMDGKLLPCHKVKEDGLVRITPGTLQNLLSGKFNDKVKRYHVLDCRFDYEFAGGHIAGATNVKSMDSLDELLLAESRGLHANGDTLPRPSRSGELEDGEQVVLVFHCEFSAKRAPTFAKHLRSRDRILNGAVYPQIYYPEVYILEGGYCAFYQSQPSFCSPQGYTPMDDPKHFERRNSDLHNFRNFGRTKSFTYGETAGPACPPLAFAAASAAIGRRGGGGGTITIAEEEHDLEVSLSCSTSIKGTFQGGGVGGGMQVDSSPSNGSGEGNSSEAEVDMSPCPRIIIGGGSTGLKLPSAFGPGSTAQSHLSLGATGKSSGSVNAPIFGSAKTRTLGRLGFQRVASYAGTGMGSGSGSSISSGGSSGLFKL